MEDLLARMEAAETVKAYMELDPRAIRDKIYWNTQDGSEPETEKEKAEAETTAEECAGMFVAWDRICE